MSEPKPIQPKAKINRFLIGFNVIAQVVAVVALVAVINVLGFNHYKRWDFSRDKKYLLSDQTHRFLKNLKQPVKVVIFFSSDPRAAGSEIFPDLINLLKEYQYAAPKRIEVETVDPFRNYTRARELQTLYKFGATENVVILDSKSRSKFVTAKEMVELEVKDATAAGPPRVRAFKGEQALTSALVEITEKTQSKVYFQSGHGEPELKSDALSGLKYLLERQNFALDSLDLQKSSSIPKDATAVAIIGPKYDLTQDEIKALREYWSNKGRLFIALDPAATTPRLAAFLGEAGIAPDNDRILRTINLTSAAGVPLTGIQRNVSAVFTEEHPVTKRFKNVSALFMGITQSLSVDPAKASQGSLKITPLILAGEGFWGETEYDTSNGTAIFFDPKNDKRPPLNIALAVEKGAINDSRVRVDSGRMIIVGNCDFLNKEALTDSTIDFTLASINWMIGRDSLIGIAPKQIFKTTLNLSDEQLQQIALFVLLLIPAAAVLLGAFAWVKRR